MHQLIQHCALALVTVACFGSCVARPPLSVEVTEASTLHTRTFRRTHSIVEDELRAQLVTSGWSVERDDGEQLEAVSATDRRFFAWLGERQKRTRVVIDVEAVRSHLTRVEVRAELEYGSRAAAGTSQAIDDEEWYRDFFEPLRVALQTRGPVARTSASFPAAERH